MGEFEAEATSAMANGGAGAVDRSLAFAVHADLSTFEFKCPRCGAPLEPMGAVHEAAGEMDASSAGVTSTVIRPVVCQRCGCAVVYGGE